MSNFEMAEKLHKHRPLLLACEAIGWLHMAGKANVMFLQGHGGQKNNYDYQFKKETLPFPWDNLLNWAKDAKYNLANYWPQALTEFITKHDDRNGTGLIGLLQAGHAMASGIEKNIPAEYLGQDGTHMWLSSAFGYPACNLFKDKDRPEILTEPGWTKLLEDIKKILEALARLGNPAEPHTTDDTQGWLCWREKAIGKDGSLRTAFAATLAETRLPNNDVTLWDQSYVAAALFKSAVAGAILEGQSFKWDNNLKQTTKWRLLTVSMPTDYYESRAVKIGDWVGVRNDLDDFFKKVRELIEVDLSLGSLLYADSEILVFTFPDINDQKKHEWQDYLKTMVDNFAHEKDFETPPYCHISEASRSLVKMTMEIKTARETMAVPLHGKWEIKEHESAKGHICPVCLMRRNGDPSNKQKLCGVCEGRRKGRQDKWHEGKDVKDTIWITEVADSNDRLALITMSLDIEPWLEGERLDSLRAQAIKEWVKNNSGSNQDIKNIGQDNPFQEMLKYITGKLSTFNSHDPVLSNLHEGYKHEKTWESFYSKIVEDRSDAPKWQDIRDDSTKAKWLTHQFFRKLASPGRIYRFQRQAEEFFQELQNDFRNLAAKNENRWRTKRLVIKPKESSENWTPGQVYNGRLNDAPVSLLYRENTRDFITICNLERLLSKEDNKDVLKGKTAILTEEDREGSKESKILIIESVEEADASLGCYQPVIPLELSPVRFRIIVPLSAASDCVDRAIQKWNEEFSRVWDRLPLRVGVVAFKRLMPFQAVIETARIMENKFEKEAEKETWPVKECNGDNSSAKITFAHPKHNNQTIVREVPVKLPDGKKEDVFYPYLAVENTTVCNPLDFQHPNGQIYRHVKDLKTDDKVTVYPAKIATVFLDQAAKRFEALQDRYLMDWSAMQEIWHLLDKFSPSQTALRGVWSELMDKQEAWKGVDGNLPEEGKKAWLDLCRTLFFKRLKVKGADLENMVQAAGSGILEWCLEWNINVLKKTVSGGKDDNSNN
jgi:CRISPR-associated Csx11 family protein